MIDPFTLRIIDPHLREEYNKAISVKAYESQFHVLVAFLFAFFSSVVYFLYIFSSETESDHSARFRLYADLVRFIVYLAVIGASYKCSIPKAYGASFMSIFFSIVLTELYTIIGQKSRSYIRYLTKVYTL